MMTSMQGQKVNIIPQPNDIQLHHGFFTFSALKIKSTNESQSIADYLIQELKKVSNKKIEIATENQISSNFIAFEKNENLESEEYHLNIKENGISIIGASDKGWFYGVQSLLQVFNRYETQNSQTSSLPKLSIKDKLAFKWRTFMLDEA